MLEISCRGVDLRKPLRDPDTAALGMVLPSHNAHRELEPLLGSGAMIEIEDHFLPHQQMVHPFMRTTIEPERRILCSERSDQVGGDLWRIDLRFEILELAHLFSPEVVLYLVELVTAGTWTLSRYDNGTDFDLSLAIARNNEEWSIF